MLIISSHSPSWEYKTRSRYIVKPNLVHEVDIHNIFSVGKSKIFSYSFRWATTSSFQLVIEWLILFQLAHLPKFFFRWTSTTSFAPALASKRWSFPEIVSPWPTSGRFRVEEKPFQVLQRSRRKISTWFGVSLQSFWIGSTRWSLTHAHAQDCAHAHVHNYILAPSPADKILQGVRASGGEHCKLPMQLHRPQCLRSFC